LSGQVLFLWMQLPIEPIHIRRSRRTRSTTHRCAESTRHKIRRQIANRFVQILVAAFHPTGHGFAQRCELLRSQRRQSSASCPGDDIGATEPRAHGATGRVQGRAVVAAFLPALYCRLRRVPRRQIGFDRVILIGLALLASLTLLVAISRTVLATYLLSPDARP